MDRHFKTESLVLERSDWDKYGHMISGEVWNNRPKIFTLRLLMLAKKFDIIHLQDRPHYLKLLRRLYPQKKLVITYHGSSIRGRWDERKNVNACADQIFVSTKDLMIGAPEGVSILHNAVDTDRFKPRKDRLAGTALTRRYGANYESIKAASKYKLMLTFMPDLVRYVDMPSLLSMYEFFIDIKRNPRGEELLTKDGVLSMTGLQALACGCKVIDSDEKIFSKLPAQHKPEHAASVLNRHYLKLIEK